MGRTGKWWACEYAGVVPDLMAIAKGFGGGVMPVGACIGSPKVWKAYINNPFVHTTTFGGNPLAMAAAIASMFVLHSENLIEGAVTKGRKFMDAFNMLQRKFPTLLLEGRGRGLMLGLEFVDNETGYLYVARSCFRSPIHSLTRSLSSLSQVLAWHVQSRCAACWHPDQCQGDPCRAAAHDHARGD